MAIFVSLPFKASILTLLPERKHHLLNCRGVEVTRFRRRELHRRTRKVLLRPCLRLPELGLVLGDKDVVVPAEHQTVEFSRRILHDLRDVLASTFPGVFLLRGKGTQMNSAPKHYVSQAVDLIDCSGAEASIRDPKALQNTCYSGAQPLQGHIHHRRPVVPSSHKYPHILWGPQ